MGYVIPGEEYVEIAEDGSLDICTFVDIVGIINRHVFLYNFSSPCCHWLSFCFDSGLSCLPLCCRRYSSGSDLAAGYLRILV